MFLSAQKASPILLTVAILAKLGPTPPPHGLWEAFLSGLVGPLPGGQPSDEVFNWLSGELPAQKQIANMTYEELLKFTDGGGVGTE